MVSFKTYCIIFRRQKSVQEVPAAESTLIDQADALQVVVIDDLLFSTVGKVLNFE